VADHKKPEERVVVAGSSFALLHNPIFAGVFSVLVTSDTMLQKGLRLVVVEMIATAIRSISSGYLIWY
jgi:hypothetical protein